MMVMNINGSESIWRMIVREKAQNDSEKEMHEEHIMRKVMSRPAMRKVNERSVMDDRNEGQLEITAPVTLNGDG